jgi:hypothetical protein
MHEPQQQREARFASVVTDVVVGGGKCLIPVFALGRAQELLLMLEEMWTLNNHLHHIPVYFASQLAKKALVIYSTYITYMNHKVTPLRSLSCPVVLLTLKRCGSDTRPGADPQPVPVVVRQVADGGQSPCTRRRPVRGHGVPWHVAVWLLAPAAGAMV